MESHQPADIQAHESEQDSVSVADLTRMIEQKRLESAIAPAEPKATDFKRIAALPPLAPIADREPDERDIAEARRRREQKAKDNLQRLAAAAGPRYANCTLESFRVATPQQRKVVAQIREYGNSLKERYAAREGLVLYGPVGTGKDHLAYTLAALVAKSGGYVRWQNGQAWFGLVRDAIDKHTSEESIIESFQKPDLLVLSDPLPPVGDLTQHQATMLYRAIDARYSHGKITITTVNVADDDEADRRMGAATWDRICDGAWKLFCNWPSNRKPSREIK
jgi:DNA replication protein DnaC